jgi:hypothetical protein
MLGQNFWDQFWELHSCAKEGKAVGALSGSTGVKGGKQL